MTGGRDRDVETARASVRLNGAGAVSTNSGWMRQTIAIQVGQL